MNDPVWTRKEVDSPCVKLCVIHPSSGLCAGCYRTLDEIGGWAGYTASQRSEIMAALPAREEQVRPKRRGRARRLQNGPKG